MRAPSYYCQLFSLFCYNRIVETRFRFHYNMYDNVIQGYLAKYPYMIL